MRQRCHLGKGAGAMSDVRRTLSRQATTHCCNLPMQLYKASRSASHIAVPQRAQVRPGPPQKQSQQSDMCQWQTPAVLLLARPQLQHSSFKAGLVNRPAALPGEPVTAAKQACHRRRRRCCWVRDGPDQTYSGLLNGPGAGGVSAVQATCTVTPIAEAADPPLTAPQLAAAAAAAVPSAPGRGDVMIAAVQHSSDALSPSPSCCCCC
jgi:hypothetical protein